MIKGVHIFMFLIGTILAGYAQEDHAMGPVLPGPATFSVHSNVPDSLLLIHKLLIVNLEATKGPLHASYKAYRENLEVYLNRKKKAKNTDKFVAGLFYSVHRKELKNYQQYASLADQYAAGIYDCLTATSLYYMYLTDLGYKARIIETEYHIYLKVITEKGEILIESTDPLGGVVTSAKEISQREAEYQSIARGQSDTGVASNQRGGQYSGIINDNVTPVQLVGLHYYNQAIAAWNSGKTDIATRLIHQACELYPSARIMKLKRLFATNSLLARNP